MASFDQGGLPDRDVVAEVSMVRKGRIELERRNFRSVSY